MYILIENFWFFNENFKLEFHFDLKTLILQIEKLRFSCFLQNENFKLEYGNVKFHFGLKTMFWQMKKLTFCGMKILNQPKFKIPTLVRFPLLTTNKKTLFVNFEGFNFTFRKISPSTRFFWLSKKKKIFFFNIHSNFHFRDLNLFKT